MNPLTINTIETKRLFLRPLTKEDVPNLSGILQDATVMYAYEHSFSDQEVIDWLEKQLHRYKTDGFGLWAVLEKNTHTFVGQCGITLQNIAPNVIVPEIGYLFLKNHWHKGYATEAALAWKEYAFSALDVPAVYAIIRDNNFPSQAVAKRLGMSPSGSLIKHYYHKDMPHTIWSVSHTPN